MGARWICIKVELVSGRGRVLDPAPGRIMAIPPRTTFEGLAEAIDTAFGRWDVNHLCQFEFPDGTVRHLPINPDAAGDAWAETERALRAEAEATMAGQGVEWHVRYLAGRVDRALTHLARAVDAAAFVVGARVGRPRRLADFVDGALSMQLSHRQHRPVVVVPLEVVDWRGRAPWE